MRHRFFLQQKWNIYIDWGNHTIMARHDKFTFYLGNQMKRTKFRKWKRKTNAFGWWYDERAENFGIMVWLCFCVCMYVWNREHYFWSKMFKFLIQFIENRYQLWLNLSRLTLETHWNFSICIAILVVLLFYSILIWNFRSMFLVWFELVLFFEFFLLSTYLVTIIFFTWIVETNVSSIVCVPI